MIRRTVKQVLGLAAAPLAMTGFAQPASATTVLTFDGNICGVSGTLACGNGSRIGQSYGDMAGVVDVSYRSITVSTGSTYEDFLKHWGAGYGDLTDAVWGGADSANYVSEIVFTPMAGYEVALIGFDAACYQNRASCRTFNYDIESLGGATIAGGSVSANWPSHASLAINSAYFTDGIVLQWGPDSYDAGVSNIAFDVRKIVAPGGVPEPASWALLLAGFGMTGAAMRRRSSVRETFA